jgi:hypothetical protein
MKKKGILLIAVILLSTAGLIEAQGGELHGVVDVTYLSKYIWRGVDIYGDKSAIQPSIDLDLYQTGFGMNVMAHRANSDMYENAERWDFTSYYHNTLFEDETYATNYTVGLVYYNFPDNSKETRDWQEVFASLSWPKICPFGVVPSYAIVHLWPSETTSSSIHRASAGAVHVVGLSYDLTAPGFLEGIPEQVFHLSSAMVYNDSMLGGAVDHDWSHAVFGVSTDFDLGNNLSFTPAFHYQSSWDDSVNNEDETWVTLSMKYKF